MKYKYLPAWTDASNFSRASHYHDYTSKMIIEENIQGHVVIDKRNLAVQS